MPTDHITKLEGQEDLSIEYSLLDEALRNLPAKDRLAKLLMLLEHLPKQYTYFGPKKLSPPPTTDKTDIAQDDTIPAGTISTSTRDRAITVLLQI